MTNSLTSKLDDIQLKADNQKNGIKFIYSLIEDNLHDYQGIFHTQEQEISIALEIISRELTNIIENLIDNETRLIGVDMLSRKKGKPNRGDISVNLGFTELKPLATMNEMENRARNTILLNKRKDFKKGFLKMFKKESEIVITDEEIEYYINNAIWSYKLILTQKGRDILNQYLEATGRKKLNSIEGKVNETRSKLFDISCSI